MLQLKNVTLNDLEQLAGKLAAIASMGDCICLKGDLGAGKSQFARFFIRAYFNDENLDVPSPSFPLVIPYEGDLITPKRSPLTHYDFYRLSSSEEAEELQFDENLNHSVCLVEWPERVSDLLPVDRIVIALSQGSKDDLRDVKLTGLGASAQKLNRFQMLDDFLSKAGWGAARWQFLSGDASWRSYIRLELEQGAKQEAKRYDRAVLMNAPVQPDGPPVKDGLPYSKIAHLAEDMAPFVAIGNYLKARGLNVPEIFAFDLEAGVLLLSDLGNRQFSDAACKAGAQEKWVLKATALLADLGRQKTPQRLPVPGKADYPLPLYDQGPLEIEVMLCLDWYWPVIKGKQASDTETQNYLDIWRALWPYLSAEQDYLVLRDYHSPNLLLVNEGSDLGVIDFQDGLLGHRAYDLVSLLQDARMDVPKELEQKALSRYIELMRESDQAFNEDQFQLAYAVLGAQRAAKLLGIFVRLCVRDQKPKYLDHLPRIWVYMQRNLAHQQLTDLKGWFDDHFPAHSRDIEQLKINISEKI